MRSRSASAAARRRRAIRGRVARESRARKPTPLSSVAAPLGPPAPFVGAPFAAVPPRERLPFAPTSACSERPFETTDLAVSTRLASRRSTRTFPEPWPEPHAVPRTNTRLDYDQLYCDAGLGVSTDGRRASQARPELRRPGVTRHGCRSCVPSQRQPTADTFVRACHSLSQRARTGGDSLQGRRRHRTRTFAGLGPVPTSVTSAGRHQRSARGSRRRRPHRPPGDARAKPFRAGERRPRRAVSFARRRDAARTCGPSGAAPRRSAEERPTRSPARRSLTLRCLLRSAAFSRATWRP